MQCPPVCSHGDERCHQKDAVKISRGHVERLLDDACHRYAVGGEAVAVQHLLDEALAAAVDRAIDPALLQVEPGSGSRAMASRK